MGRGRGKGNGKEESRIEICTPKGGREANVTIDVS
jgi:hypothetical protein